jgi:hypothetical protein
MKGAMVVLLLGWIQLLRGISAVGSFLFKAEMVRIPDELFISPSQHLK